MKRLIFAGLIVAAGAPAALAYANAPQLLTAIDRAEIAALVPGADLGDLTPDQAAALSLALHSAEDNEKGPLIRAILN